MTAPKVRWEVRNAEDNYTYVRRDTRAEATDWMSLHKGRHPDAPYKVVKVTTRPAGAFAALQAMVAALPSCCVHDCGKPATGTLRVEDAGCFPYCDKHGCGVDMPPGLGWHEYNFAATIRAAVAALEGGHPAPDGCGPVCACACHGDAEEPGPHLPSCKWADPAFEGRS